MNWEINEDDLDNSQRRVYNLSTNQSCVVKSCCGEYINLVLWKIFLFQELDAQSTVLIIYHSHHLEYLSVSGYVSMGLNEKQITFIQQEAFYSLNTIQKYDFVFVLEIEEFTEKEIQNTLNFYGKSISFFGSDYQVVSRNESNIEYIANLLKLQMFELFNCYKLPVGIANFIKILDSNYDIVDKCKNKNKSQISIIQFNSWQEELNWISETIDDRHISDALILVPHFISFGKLNSVKHITTFFKERKWHFLSSLSHFDNFSSLSKLMTFTQSKFYDSDCIFFPFVNDLQNTKEFRVALSQACSNVILTYSGELPDFIKQIPTEYYEHN